MEFPDRICRLFLFPSQLPRFLSSKIPRKSNSLKILPLVEKFRFQFSIYLCGSREKIFFILEKCDTQSREKEEVGLTGVSKVEYSTSGHYIGGVCVCVWLGQTRVCPLPFSLTSGILIGKVVLF